jgi:hypothetical protein
MRVYLADAGLPGNGRIEDERKGRFRRMSDSFRGNRLFNYR